MYYNTILHICPTLNNNNNNATLYSAPGKHVLSTVFYIGSEIKEMLF